MGLFYFNIKLKKKNINLFSNDQLKQYVHFVSIVNKNE